MNKYAQFVQTLVTRVQLTFNVIYRKFLFVCRIIAVIQALSFLNRKITLEVATRKLSSPSTATIVDVYM